MAVAGSYGITSTAGSKPRALGSSLAAQGLVPTPAIPVAATPVAAITPRTPMITIIPVIPAAAMIPVGPITTVVAVAMASAKTAEFEDFRDSHIVLSFIFSWAFEPTGVSRGIRCGGPAPP